VLLVPPEVNESSIVDFGPGQSLAAAFGAAGFEVAAIEWQSASRATASRTIDDSVAAILRSADELGGRVHLVGVCQGGWESAVATALQPAAVASLTLVAAPVDFGEGEGVVQHVARLVPMPFYATLVAMGGGVMRGSLISLGFDTLVPFERFVLKPLRVWNHIEDDDWMDAFRMMEDWYRFPKDIAGPLYLDAVRQLFKDNRLVRGRFVCLGERVDLGRITCPLCLVAGARDHITPSRQVWATRRAASSKRVLEVETGGGHIGAFMGREALRDRWPTVFEWLRAGEVEGCDAPS
jgi:poly(3-hydroxyalkanoate) synthetase